MEHVKVGKSADGRWVAEVLLDCADSAQLISAAEAYNRLSLPELPPCLASEECPKKLFFLLHEGPRPESLFSDQGDSKLSSDQCSEFASALVRISTALNSVGLGLWKARRELCFRVNGRLLVVPSFWVPLLSAEALRADPALAPEIRSGTAPERFSATADVYAIASACYEALADSPPLLPNPKLPGEWDKNLSSWDAALDAGLRVKPERRPTSPTELGQLLPSFSTASLPGGTTGEQQQEYSGQVASRKKTRLRPILACVLVAAVLYGVWHFRHLIPTSPSEIKQAFVPDYQRGFGPYVIRYSKRDYENASWKVIYSYEQIPFPNVEFRTITGWDKHNLLVLGSSHGSGAGFLQIKMADGKWSYSGFNEEGYYATYEALFLDKSTFLLSHSGQTSIGLTLNTPAGTERLAGSLLANDRGQLYATDNESFYCNHDYGPTLYHYTEHRIEKVEERKRCILNENNEVVTWPADSDGRMQAARIEFVSTLRPGEAVGLWLFKAYVLVDGSGGWGAALVRYRNGFWYLTQRLNLKRSEIYAVWFLDERTCIIANNNGIFVIEGDKVLSKRIIISGQDLTNQHFYRIWGSSLDDFCLLDSKGNVYHFTAGTWKLAVRGPDLKKDKSAYDDHNDSKFRACWISPDGAIFGLRAKEIYRLD